MSQYEVDFNIESFGKDENDIQYLKRAIETYQMNLKSNFKILKMKNGLLE
ncbi:hypothetical protein ACY2C8_00640 [Mammaliicoccus sciuri]